MDEFLCVVCPNGCVIDAEFEDTGDANGKRLSGVAGSVLVKNGDFITASVRTTRPIPLARVMDVMGDIRAQNPEAPLRIGQVLISNPRGLDTDIIVTRNVNRLNRNIGS